MLRCRRWISLRCLGLVALAGSLATCSSPLEPGECRDGHDGLGRGPTNFYTLSCSYVGSDTIQCASQHAQVGYCASSTRSDVTATTVWSTSNPAAATFVSPGVLTITGAGQVQVTAKIGFDQASGDYDVHRRSRHDTRTAAEALGHRARCGKCRPPSRRRNDTGRTRSRPLAKLPEQRDRPLQLLGFRRAHSRSRDPAGI